MKAAIYNRVSGNKQEKEGTSLQTQLEACIFYCKQKGYEVVMRFSETFSGLTLDRPKLNELRNAIRSNEVDVLVVHCLDRFSRDPTHGVILQEELEKHNTTLEAVTETIESTELGKLISYIRGFASKLEAEKIRERTMRGKKARAEQGHIPSGFGRYQGYLGLRYDKNRKMLVHVPGQIETAAEILESVINKGLSISQITRNLQAKGVKGAAGGYIHRSSVSRVLHNAKVYAGFVKWNNIVIRDKVEKPIITDEQANIVAERQKFNKVNSLGFGKKKWLSGRVFCQLCGRRYNLDSNKGCYCNGADNRNPVKCQSPKINLKEISSIAYGTMILALSEPASIIEKARKNHHVWQQQKNTFDQIKKTRERQQAELEKRRHLISFQHESGGLTDKEYLKRLEQIKKDESEGVNYNAFTAPEPPTSKQIGATVNRLGRFMELRQHSQAVLEDSQSNFARELAEEVGLQLIIGNPIDDSQRYSVQVKMNLPIIEEKLPFPSEEDIQVMVITSSVCCAHRQPPLPAHVLHAPALLCAPCR